MTETDITDLKTQITELRAFVTGHAEVSEAYMKRAMPVIEAYEEAQKEIDVSKKYGMRILWLSGAVTAVGSAYMVLHGIFWGD